MKTITSSALLFCKHYLIISLAFVSYINTYAQEDDKTTAQDSTSTTFSFGNLNIPDPDSIQQKYTYDPITDRYIYTESVGSFNINYPVILTPEEYQSLVFKENLKKYYKEKIDAFDGLKQGSDDQQKNLIPDLYVNSGFFETIFGSREIKLIPQGNVEVDLGVLFTKQDNPSFSPRNRSNFTFDFDQRISLSLIGKVGTRLNVSLNYDTESTFGFQNIFKLEYTPLGEVLQDELDKKTSDNDGILRKLELGNVNMPISNSLITGAQSLFGVKTELQFGKTTVTAVFSEQRSETRSIVAEAGGTIEEFQFFALDYDENRHFFLAQYFRDKYNIALEQYPFINSNIQIKRIEVWITNRVNQTDNIRNIVAIQDLGESNPVKMGLDPIPAGFINTGPNAFPDNSNNDFNPITIGTTSVLTEDIRDIATAQQGFGTLTAQVSEGLDYGKFENARKLEQGRDFNLHTELGYISLTQRLQNDEIIAVAFQYTVGDQVYQVGEFSGDGIDATDTTTTGTGVQLINNNTLVLKMLKSPITNVNEPIWDLMMKNIYNTGAFQLSPEDFRLNIFYTETSPLNYITSVTGTPFPTPIGTDDPIEETALLRVFNLDRLNFNNDLQDKGDGFFDYVPGITVIQQYGKIVFTTVEPFGDFLFEKLRLNIVEDYEGDEATAAYNDNQRKYVYRSMYQETKTAALEDANKNKFEIKGRYKSTSSAGIPIGAFNVPRGSVRVTAGGRVLIEGVDYTVNYQLGTVQILDPALQESNTPINVSVENNAVFGQQTKRFMGIHVDHQFNKNFLLGGTFLNLNERPLTQKANLGTEPINNTILGLNGNFSTEVPFLTRLVNKLPNIDTDVASNLSVRGEFAYLLPGSPKGTEIQGEATSYIDDFEGSQSGVSLLSPQTWRLSSRPLGIGAATLDPNIDNQIIDNGYDRAFLNWYTIDPIFYSSQRPGEINDDDVSDLYTRRVFIDEIFPEIDLVTGQTTVIPTLDLTYYPTERGPYNFRPGAETGVDPNDAWAGITRQINTTDLEQSNVEYIEFWLLDPFLNNTTSLGGKLTFNLGNISEDIIKDGRKIYENGLPEDGNVIGVLPESPSWQTVYPQNQSLIYAFSSTGQERTNQDVGYDGYDDVEEGLKFASFSGLEDPANDNYSYFLNTSGDIFERYRRYNGNDGNSLDTFSDTNRAYTTQPDVEDINQDNTMNTIDSYFQYELDITPAELSDLSNVYIVDRKENVVPLPNGNTATTKWYQFRIPLADPDREAIGGISDFRSIRFVRMFLTDFSENTTLRFGSIDLVRSDWRRYLLSLDSSDPDPDDDGTNFSVGIIGIQENDGNYVSPPGIEREELNNNNTIVRQNEQSLLLNACTLQRQDSRAVYKNINVDMRQFKRLRMFMHAEEGDRPGLVDNGVVGFIRMGNDYTDNYYQIEVPLKLSTGSPLDPEAVWPEDNRIDLQIDLLSKIKALGISAGTLSNLEPTFYNVINGELNETAVANPAIYDSALLTDYVQRIAVKGNPNFGDIRTLMVGIKNIGPGTCAEVWYNELRLSDMDNEGGWAAVVGVDTQVADFMNISATARQSTAGFGAIEEGPNQRNREDIKQYDVVTNINLGQLLPKQWGIQIPFNYGQGEELITPKYDQRYRDLELQDRLDAAASSEERNTIKEQSESYTKRQSINFIGVRKNRSAEAKPRIYDIENFTFNYSYNKVDHRDFEIERSLDQAVRVGANYNYSFKPIKIEPFKKNDSIFKNKYWKILKDFNINILPTNFSVNADYNRQFNKQKFRDFDLGAGNIGIEELFKRNYTFDYQYTINYNLTDALQLNFSAANNNIVRNYFINDDILGGEQDPRLDVWDGFFDVGDPNRQTQQLGINYELPLYKIPTLSFLRATYAYTGDFQWQKGSDLFGNLEVRDDQGNPTGQTANLGNSISNANSHTLNAALDMKKFYKYLGFVRKNPRRTPRQNPSSGGLPDNQTTSKSKKHKAYNTLVDVLTSIKRVQFNYSEINGTYLPGYLRTPGFIGTFKPTLGYTFGSQRDIRHIAARNGWLTTFQNFNQQYTEVETKNLDIAINVEPFNDFKIDFTGGRTYQSNFSENYNAPDIDGDGLSDRYESLLPNTFGNFNISTNMIRTAFGKSDEVSSKTFDDFRENRLTIANRLATNAGINIADPANLDADGFPEGFGKTNQAVMLPAFLSAYTGQKANKVKLRALRDIPIPGWNLRYTGLMKIKWFRKTFKRFSIAHGYNSIYTINQFRTNLDYTPFDPSLSFEMQNPEAIDQGDNYKNAKLYSNINLTEQFSPLFRVDFELKNSLKILAEVRRDRSLSLSFDNNLLTEIQGKEYTLGLGYRIKDVKINSQLAKNKVIKSDLIMDLNASYRDNKTIIRYLDVDNNQITGGQSLWNLKYTADYAFSKNFTGIFYFDYTFSEYAISTAFPQTTIRSGITLRYNFGN